MASVFDDMVGSGGEGYENKGEETPRNPSRKFIAVANWSAGVSELFYDVM